MRAIVELLGHTADRAIELRDNPEHRRGRRRRRDAYCDLFIIEQNLRVAANALRDILEHQEAQ